MKLRADSGDRQFVEILKASDQWLVLFKISLESTAVSENVFGAYCWHISLDYFYLSGY